MTEKKPFVSIQADHVVDGMSDDGHPRYQKPYPYLIDAEGMVGQQDFWSGMIFRCVGVKHSVHTQQVDIWWSEVFADPSKAMGKYPVFLDKDGKMFALTTGIVSAETTMLPVDF